MDIYCPWYIAQSTKKNKIKIGNSSKKEGKKGNKCDRR
jgi:hypothetical protein